MATEKKHRKPAPTEFAVIETGGKQYLVSEGQTLMLEKLEGDPQAGSKVSFDKVFLTVKGGKTDVGAPLLKGAKVTGEVLAAGKGDKVVVIHYRAKSRYFRKNGHRQPFTKVKVTAI
ncbi:MAG TPA: 50S ribosomal protein L21 [Candidatus Paceibacterota bacterium]